MTDHPAYLRWTPADEIAYDDGATVQVCATLCQRRDGQWCWAATVAAYTVKVAAFDAAEFGPAMSSGPQLADDEAAARAKCEWWIEAARLDRLGLKHMPKETPHA